MPLFLTPLRLGVGVDDRGYGLAALILARRLLPLDLALNELVARAPGTIATSRHYTHATKDKGMPSCPQGGRPMDHKVMLILLLWLALQAPLGSLVGRFIKIGLGEAKLAKSMTKYVPFYVASNS